MTTLDPSRHPDFERKLRPFVARRVPASEVDDVLQDVFVRVQRGLPALRDEERLLPWLYKVARSAVQESARQRARHPLARGEGAEPAVVEPEVSVALKTGLAEFAAAAITRLPSPYKEALTLTELQGVTQRAAAKRLGLSTSGMKSRVQRGRDQLRELLEVDCNIALDVRGGVIACEPRERNRCSCSRSDD
ncbi:MAG: polymerase sigma factor SigZ [Polyangiaceae bacterium]|jgi:RNA polymerase sigma-70 factor (ECF subfamily)|nr:polymerase sigma factor SigZ [Polyangiaceae bacterium]